MVVHVITVSDIYAPCQKCGKKLTDDVLSIRFDKNHRKVFKCRLCKSCSIYYTLKTEEFMRAVTDNMYAEGVFVDGKRLWDITKRKRFEYEKEMKRRQLNLPYEKLDNVKSSLALINIKYKDNECLEEFIIVTDKKYESKSEHIIDYRTDEARELLAAALVSERRMAGSLGNRRFEVVKLYSNKSRHEA